MPEHVENDLHALDARILDGLQRFLDPFDAHTVVLDLAGLGDIVQRLENFRAVIHLRRWTVQLQQVDAFDAEVAQAAVDEAGEIALVVSVRRVRRETSARFRCHNDLLGAFTHYFADEPFAVPIPVHVGGVDEVDAEINRAMERRQRLAVIHGSPGSADGPRAKADFRNLPTGTT